MNHFIVNSEKAMETALGEVETSIKLDDKHPHTYAVSFPTKFWSMMWHQEFIRMVSKIDPKPENDPNISFYYTIEEEGMET